MTENGPEDTREGGIEFGDLMERLDTLDYPISQHDLLEQVGEEELEFSDGAATLEELLSETNEDQYDDAESVRQAVFNMVGDEAVGRKEYSDRGVHSLSKHSEDESL